MKGKKGHGLPVAKMMGSNVQSGGKPVTMVSSGNPNVVKEAKKKTVGMAMGTAAKPRMDRASRKKGGIC